MDGGDDDDDPFTIRALNATRPIPLRRPRTPSPASSSADEEAVPEPLALQLKQIDVKDVNNEDEDDGDEDAFSSVEAMAAAATAGQVVIQRETSHELDAADEDSTLRTTRSIKGGGTKRKADEERQQLKPPSPRASGPPSGDGSPLIGVALAWMRQHKIPVVLLITLGLLVRAVTPPSAPAHLASSSMSLPPSPESPPPPWPPSPPPRPPSPRSPTPFHPMFMPEPPPPPPPPPSPLPPSPPPPSPLPPPRPLTHAERLAELNDRFEHARPSNSLEEAGVMVRQFDSLDDHTKPWLACPETGNNNWCRGYSDRWATSIITPKARMMYYGVEGIGGLVLAPTARLFCAYPEDGNSMAKLCRPLGGDGVTCIPGCYPRGQQCADVGHAWSCSFPPTQLGACLRAQEQRVDFLHRNNEIVVDMRSIEQNLPHAIAGFFYCARSGSSERSKVELARNSFLSHYHLSNAEGPPLLVLDLPGGGSRPFSLAV